ncbi:putative methyltransferase-like protein 7A [Harpia harpyja]|uniref:putative methyltransferase-like protein 7A n=1 Tax=Harpia harpyja TaxID=202280 RepID=UPI0022B0FD1E|nr:putative methyltransferase-like protein 7A [Harpia harpyja]
MLLIASLQRCVQLLLLPLHVLACLGFWGSFYKKVFPHVMAKVSPIYNHKVYKQKQELFSSLRKFAGPPGQLVLLEIGTGTGTNFQFCPAGCRLTCTDPNPNFRKFLLKSLSENQHLKLEHLVVASGEDLHQIPDGTMDMVVCTLVLCSVTNIKKVLMEVLRVLRPSGAFYFLEHVAADHSSWTYFWQKVCDPVWQYFGDGCSLSRETEKELEKTNFSELNLRRIHVTPYWIPSSPHIIGYAVK